MKETLRSFRQRGGFAGDYSVQEGKCSSNNSLPELLQWDAEAEIFNLPEELLEEQSCESKLFFTCFPPFLNYSGSGALHLYYHLPLSVRLQKLKRKGYYLFFFPSVFGWEPWRSKRGRVGDTEGVSTCLVSVLKQWSGVKQGIWWWRWCVPSP